MITKYIYTQILEGYKFKILVNVYLEIISKQ